ncbi:hypothetical protein [Mycobacterium deserti]|uniref:PE domain-containing protein n=1 Tax=Mycobacterium deserti TaxID=2978347 RepID=A0ABT2M9R2_9MYCO|nr:hypothetical protein [Mycobacterium deserti]MCT7659001.1 hypothetical protein [Mycobacterium deserti]
MPETLRVDTGLVSEASGSLQTIAGAIPPPPTVSSPSGTDALSAAIAAKINELVDPVIAQMPISKEELKKYAEKVATAARTYDNVDRMLAEEIQRRVEDLDNKFGKGSESAPEGANPAVGAPSGGAGAPSGGGRSEAGGGAAASGGSGAGGAAAPASQPAGQMGQTMQDPTQMAQQASQSPGQMPGMVTAVPQAAAQGLQSVMQTVGQLSESSGAGDEPADAESRLAEPGSSMASLVTGAASGGAAPGSAGGERAPEAQQNDSPADSAKAPAPALTRSAESAPEIEL